MSSQKLRKGPGRWPRGDPGTPRARDRLEPPLLLRHVPGLSAGVCRLRDRLQNVYNPGAAQLDRRFCPKSFPSILGLCQKVQGVLSSELRKASQKAGPLFLKPEVSTREGCSDCRRAERPHMGIDFRELRGSAGSA